jgi:hypothetical protein
MTTVIDDSATRIRRAAGQARYYHRHARRWAATCTRCQDGERHRRQGLVGRLAHGGERSKRDGSSLGRRYVDTTTRRHCVVEEAIHLYICGVTATTAENEPPPTEVARWI